MSVSGSRIFQFEQEALTVVEILDGQTVNAKAGVGFRGKDGVVAIVLFVVFVLSVY